MTTTRYPVDSTTRTCCGGIGRHTRNCKAPAVAPPAGAKADIWEGDQRVVMGADRTIEGHELVVWTSAVQYSDGSLRQVFVHVDMPTNDHMTSDQARALAAQFIAAADEINRWVTCPSVGI